MKFRKPGFVILLLAVSTTIAFFSCQHAPYELPPDQRVGDPSICFEGDILPIFVSNCAKSGCHTGSGEGGSWRFDSYDNIMRKGIVPGNPAASKIYQVIAGTAGQKMPPKSEPALTQDQVDLISRWIAAGAVNGTACISSCDSSIHTYSAAVKPLFQKYCTGCHYTGATGIGGVVLDNYTDAVAAATDSAILLGCIRHDIGYSQMPKEGVTLSDCQVSQIELWIKNGMQND